MRKIFPIPAYNTISPTPHRLVPDRSSQNLNIEIALKLSYQNGFQSQVQVY